jgi:hypothetical protein
MDVFWGEPIYSYTDEQAVEDGILVDISELNIQFNNLPVNRITRTLWEEFQPFLSEHPKSEMPTKMQQLASIIKTKLKLARNSGEDDYLYILPPKIWLVKNELNSYTLMNPSEY